MYKYVAVDMFATVFTFVGRSLINSSMRGSGGTNDDALLGESGKLLLVIGHKIWVGNRGSGVSGL